MSVSRDTSKGTWTVYARYTDWQGKVKVLHKRGFKTKREAVEYEREYLLKKSKDVTMGFAQFVECYLEDLKPRLKYNTYLTKEHIIRTKILPYFEDKALADICTSDIMQWQNEILQMRDDDGKGYSPTYLKTISAQMSAIFNHATRYYDLKNNPCKKVGNMGKKKAKEMLFWTRDEFLQFIETMKSKPMSYYAFELLFWTGIREGELLALTNQQLAEINEQIESCEKRYAVYESKLDMYKEAEKPIKKELATIREHAKVMPTILGGEALVRLPDSDYRKLLTMAQTAGTLGKMNYMSRSLCKSRA